VRYFLDTEFNGFGGALLSIALVPDDGEDFYAVLECGDPIEPWVQRHVLPYLDTVPVALQQRPLSRAGASAALQHYLQVDDDPLIVADWPEDIAQFCMLMLTGSGTMITVPPVRFELLPLPGFSTARNSVVPHNALHDARAFRDHVLTHLE
jgi:hypothetical protein